MKPVIWIGASKRDLRAFSSDALRAAGRELERVQRGADPVDWKPMTVIGRGAREIRLHIDGARRVFYVATFPEAVYVLHAFQKKTPRTAPRDLTLGQQRYQLMLQRRSGK